MWLMRNGIVLSQRRGELAPCRPAEATPGRNGRRWAPRRQGHAWGTLPAASTPAAATASGQTGPADEEQPTMTTTTRPTVSTDLLGVPYRSQRSPVMAVNGVVATSQPLAAQA